jgi:type VI secretion system protein ImpC
MIASRQGGQERRVQYEVNFGVIAAKPRAATGARKFRLALLGDFSGRANAGRAETGEALARRKPIRVDVDNLDDIVARMKLELTLSLDGEEAVVTVPVASMDDFHPDQIVENVELFASLRDLRRNLASKTGFARASREVLSWGGEAPLPPPPRRAAGSAIATDRKLSDFARLTGRPGTAEAADQSVDALLRRLVGPFVQPARDARQDQLTARVDEALSATMNRILHHPDFQAAEALWRGVEFLVRRIETGAAMEIVLYDVSAEELAADIAATDQLDASGLYGLLIEQPALDAGQGALSAVIGLYGFELMPPHADLLGRIAQVAAAAGAPFIAGIAPDALKTPIHEQHKLTRAAWTALRELPAAAYLGLAAPRFLLRMPYGKKSDPIDAFAFEEFTRQSGLSGMLWGHPALIPALLLAQTFARQGVKMKPGSVMTAGDMAYYVYTDTDGDQIALPCTERLYTEKQAVAVSNYGVMPLLSLRGRPELRLGGFLSVAGPPIAGFWAPAAIPTAPAAATPAAATPSAATGGASPSSASPPAASPSAAAPAEEPAAATAAEAEVDLDALLASLSASPAEPQAAEAPAAEALTAEGPAAEGPATAAEDDLDALLASLNAEPPPAAPDATEADLDALLASLG